MTSEIATTAPRLHQVSPTTVAMPRATSTPATTLAMRCRPWATVSYMVSWTTSSAVSAAMTGWSLVCRRLDTTYARTAARVDLAVRSPGM
jgi:hypothetical protein